MFVNTPLVTALVQRYFLPLLSREMRSGDRPLDDNTEIMMPLTLTEGQTLGPAPSYSGAS